MLDITETSVTYQGGDTQYVFPIPFPFLASAHIRARITNADGESRALMAGIDYSINMISDGNGELILLEDSLAVNWTLTISRLVPITQDILFHNQGPNSPNAVEQATDKLTMIAQQLDSRLDACLVVPEGFSAEEFGEELINSAGKIHEFRQEIAGVKNDVAGKADSRHIHVLTDVDSLQQELAQKADTSQLLDKADISQLAQKADKVHRHSIDDVDELVSVLADKLDSDDPRLDGLAQPASHAKSHCTGGEDRITPEDIGSLSAPPADGKTYLAVSGGWVEYIPPTGGDEEEEGIGTMDHSQLLNRSAADQHPQSAIQNLTADLGAIRSKLDQLDDADEILSESITKKADKTDLPSLATTEKDGLLSASDKQRIDGMNPLPVEGDAGDFLQKSTGGATWINATTTAGSLPLMTATQKGVARLSANAGLELDAGGSLGIKADNLISKANVESRLSGHDVRIGNVENSVSGLSYLPNTVSGLQTSVENSSSQITSIQSTLSTLGSLAFKADAPSDGKTYLRKNGTWVEYTEPEGGSGDGAIPGEIRLFPFRTADLPKGWYLCNGDQFSLSSAQGDALYALPVSMKSDWEIKVNNSNINLPNFFAGNDGFFLRAVNNSARYPGNKQTDSMRNIKGSFVFASNAGLPMYGTSAGSSSFTGSLFCPGGSKSFGPTLFNYGASTTGDLHFDASRSVPVAHEFRPINIGMTPAIYLGV